MALTTIESLKRWREYFDYLNTPHTKIIAEKRFIVDYQDLCQYDTELVDSLFENAEETISSGEKALEEIFESKIKLRIRKYGQFPSNIIGIREIRSAHLNKLKVIKGMVKQASKVIPLIVSSTFECPICGNLLTVLQSSGLLKTPDKCGCGRKGRFIKIKEEQKDSQRIVVQEDIETLEGTQAPSEIGVILQDDLTNPNVDMLISQGSRVAITGTIKDTPKFTKRGESTERDFMFMANSLEPLEDQYKEIKITQDEIREMKELSKNPDLKQLMIDSYCPEIYGENMVKLGIVLQIFGARPKYKDGRKVKSGNFHILLIGDPSKGKSTLSQFASAIAPKYQYASGKGTTGRGLTAYIVKDEFLGTWGVQAGAVVLASGGVAVVDEIDKMDEEEQGHLSQCMSEQRIKITKTINTSLRAETAIIACANFKDGRFNSFNDTFSQIDFPIWMINRFALIFVMKDEVDIERDKRVFKAIMNKYKGVESSTPAINLGLIKKYVIYAKQNIFPEWTAEAEIEVENTYIGLRKKIQNLGENKFKTIPINERQLENLNLISEASARMRLSNRITKADVETAKEILFASLKQVAFDIESGSFDIESIETGVSTKTMNIVQQIKEIIQELDKSLDTIPIETILGITKQKGIDDSKVEDIIERLKRSGDYFEPKSGFIKLL